MSYVLTTSAADNEGDCHHQDDADSQTSSWSSSWCNRHWDHLLCWPSMEANVTLAIPCNASRSFVEIVTASRPAAAVNGDIPGLAYQQCGLNGSWNAKTDYVECMTFLNEILSEEETRRKVRHAVSLITFGLCLTSALLLLVALAIFSFFQSLKCDRLRVHKNFMLALVIRYVVSIVYYEPYIYGQDDPDVWFRDKNRGYLCKMMLTVLLYGYVAPIFWMFVEGVYLHSRVVTDVFDSPAPFTLYFLIGWVVPFCCVAAWVAAMVLSSSCDISSSTTLMETSVMLEKENNNEEECGSNNNVCWEGYTDRNSIFILSVPMMLALTVNLLFLVKIVRIVVTKVQTSRLTRSSSSRLVGPTSASSSSSHELSQVKKAVRATLILFPLLGVTNLLFFINPKNGTHDKLYMLFNATMQSSQGIFLAILYCFCNSEVQHAIRRYASLRTSRKHTRRSIRLDTTSSARRHNASMVNKKCNLNEGKSSREMNNKKRNASRSNRCEESLITIEMISMVSNNNNDNGETEGQRE